MSQNTTHQFIGEMVAGLMIYGRYARLLSTLPAAKSVHHAFIGGWVMHTFGMMIIADNIYNKYHEIYKLNRSLLMAGIFLHDIGKFREFQLSAFGLVADYPMEGKLIGHPALGAIIMAIYNVGGVPAAAEGIVNTQWSGI